VTYVVIRKRVHERHFFRLAGLDPNKRYLNEQTGQVLSGKTWMSAGMCVQGVPNDFTSLTFHLVAVD
jgi:hypothetical protein